MLVTVERYLAITGDTCGDETAIADALEGAEALLADVLGRPLEEAERTERLWPTRDGRLWPSATPIVSVQGGWEIDGHALRYGSVFGVPSFLDPDPAIEVTYTGGWVERTANPDAPNRLPACIERDLAVNAFRLAHPTPQLMSLPAGANSVRLGDAAVSAPAGVSLAAQAMAPTWSALTLRYRRRQIGGLL